jgi:hypothetical protein
LSLQDIHVKAAEMLPDFAHLFVALFPFFRPVQFNLAVVFTSFR